jgi:hypothetical protein
VGVEARKQLGFLHDRLQLVPSVQRFQPVNFGFK